MAQHLFLFIGEEGAMLAGAGVTAHQDKEQILATLAQQEESEITVLADVQRQKIITEDLPPLSSRDRRKLAERRLNQNFSHTDLRACLQLERTSALLGSVETKDPLKSWIEALAKLPHPFDEIGLVPFELLPLIKKLQDNTPQHTDWLLFLGYHPTSGFRQIALYKGQWMFTRLTPTLPASTSAGFAAANVAVDLKATRDYLARLGLSKESPLHLLAIIPPSMKKAFEVTPLDVSSRQILTPHESAIFLNLTKAITPEETRTEAVYLAWFDKMGKCVAPLMTPQGRKRKQARQTIKRLHDSLLILAVFFLFLAFYWGWGIGQKMVEISHLQKESVLLYQELDEMQNALLHEREPLEHLRRAAERQRLYAPKQPVFFEILPHLAQALGNQTRLISLVWEKEKLSVSLSPTTGTFPEILEKLRKDLPDLDISSAGEGKIIFDFSDSKAEKERQ